MIVVALVICAGIGAAVYFGVDGILKSVRGLKLKLNVLVYNRFFTIRPIIELI